MRFSSSSSSSAPLLRRGLRLLAAIAVFAAGVIACTPSIGDKCTLSTDCSVNGDRLCDTSQPDGYCTQFNCAGDGCPDKAACVLFSAAVPGCAYNDYTGGGGSRVGRSFCVARCFQQADCRPGYVCADPRVAPWNALILDDPQDQLTCLVAPDVDASTVVTNAPVCSATGPTVSPIDAGPPRTPADASVPPFLPDAGVSDAGGADAADAADGG